MSRNFYSRLRDYYGDVVKALHGESNAASVFLNSTDKGMAREKVYLRFLRDHTPKKCNVNLGGFLFDEAGNESGQLDIIVTTDTTPRFELHNQDGASKIFSPVEGTLMVASIKSRLDTRELVDSLEGFSAIPATEPLGGRGHPNLRISNYEDWPFKVIYATDGNSLENILEGVRTFYDKNPHIPSSRRPNLIHVLGKYCIYQADGSIGYWDFDKRENVQLPKGAFHALTRDADIQGLLWVTDTIQRYALASTHILFTYSGMINKIHDLPAHL